MNKGRNFFILMSCLLLLGLLTFLTRTKLENRSGVVDNVRYILKSSVTTVKNYEFYFTDDMVMTGTLENADGSYTLHLYVREAYDETLQDYLTQPYAYYYTVSGSQKSNAAVEWHYEEDAEEAQKTGEPYERFTERVFISMIYGTDSIITIWQAIAVAIIAVTGGVIIGKAEELWHILYKKPEEENPVWEDMNGIKRTGIGILIFDGVLLLVFIFL